MRFFPLLVAATIAMTAPAFSSDLVVDEASFFSPVPVSDWTGFYVGANGAYGWGVGDQDVITDTLGFLDTAGAAIPISGGLLGVTAGFNYQMGDFVAGLEGDLGWANIRGYTNPDGNPDNDGYETTIDWLGTLRGRAGYSFDSFLVYGTAGVATAGFGIQNGDVAGDVFDPLTGTASAKFAAFGWVVGAGVEVAVMDNVSVKAEYNYYDFGNILYSAALSTGGLPEQGSLTSNMHVLKVGVNYSY